MKLDAPKNSNYAAVVVRVNILVDLPGLDNLIGIPVLGHQALTQKGIQAGDLRIAFTAETALSLGYCYHNNLFRDATLNSDQSETGYLEKNRRVRAIKLRGHSSNALLMPLSSLSYLGVKSGDLKEGDAFDAINGHPVCKKYEVPVKVQRHQQKSKIERAFRRVDSKLFPEHLETDQYHRSKHLLQPGREVVVSQKLHGTSWRGGRVPVLRQLKWYERLLRKLGVKIPDYEYDIVFGSRKVIKDPKSTTQQHYYDGKDIWTEYGQKIAELIPEGYLVYGELVGYTPDGTALQKGYTYHLSTGEAELFVYRVAHINRHGVLSDLSWDGVKDFCKARGLKWTPELLRLPVDDPRHFLFEEGSTDLVDDFLDRVVDSRYADGMTNAWDDWLGWNEEPLPLSDPKTVDEGVCIRQEGIVPLILKAKSAKFLEHETKLLDKGEIDMESAA